MQLSSFVENLSNGTRFAEHLENLGIDVDRVSRSLKGLTAGDMMERVTKSAGNVRGEARRLRNEAVRVQRVSYLFEGEGFYFLFLFLLVGSRLRVVGRPCSWSR